MLAPGSSIGRYVVKRRLAEGGMAEVYLAQATGPEGFAKDVVIKVVRSFLASDQQFVDMFIAEARLSSKLNHANVVQIFDFGKDGDSYFIAMEYVRGASLFDLRKRCRERGIAVPPTLVAEIGAQVARGLQYAHALTDKGKSLGIVHRDVTPHNVLLSFDGAVKLTDFGIAKASTTHTAPGILKGKFAYMSPEQARGDPVDARTDLFALGIVLWELLTGGRLFDGDSELAVLRAVQESLIAPPSRLNPDTPQELSDLVLKALSRPPAERFQTGFELDKALATFVLRAAKSIEDSSVALFMQQVYRDEITADEGERLGTPVGTPRVQRGVVPQAASFGSADTLAVDRSADLGRGRSPASAAPPPQTEQHPALGVQREPPSRTPSGKVKGAAGPPRTDMMPAHRSTPVPATLVPTEVVPRDVGPQRGTDPERAPLGAQLKAPDNSTIRVSDSVKLDLARSLEAQRAKQAARPVDPTVLKPRTIDLALKPPEPVTSPTAPVTPPPRVRSPVLIGVSVVVGAGVLLGALWALRPKGEGAPEEKAPASGETPAAVALAPAPAPAAPAEESPTVPPTEPSPAALEPVAVPPEAPTPVAATAPSKTVAPVPTRFGVVSIKAAPFAEVVVDGRKVGEAQGVRQFRLAYGAHKVTLVHPRRSETFTVTIDGKATPELAFDANR